MMDDEIGKSLGLEPMKPPLAGEVVEVIETKSLKDIDKSDQPEKDFQYARDNFYNVIEKGTEALEDMLHVAKASEHPRAYEVVSTLMKTLVDANKDLVAMGEKKAKAQEPEEEKKVTNNNLFVGSTAELQQLLKDMRNDND
jgi:heme oxygenase